MAQIEGGDRVIIDPLFLCTPNCKQDMCKQILKISRRITISNTNSQYNLIKKLNTRTSKGLYINLIQVQ